MNSRADTGKRGEAFALQFLLEKGYTLLETNWRFQHKEVDIIATDGSDLVFAEVKTRTSHRHGEPEEAVDLKKQRFLIEAADAYVNSKDLDVNVRFDIISVVLHGSVPDINHIEDAFYPEAQ